jgi:hypothetical protein
MSQVFVSGRRCPLGIWRAKLFLLLVLGFLVTQVVMRPRYRVGDLALSLFLFGVYAACVHVRFLVLFVIFFAPMLASLLARWTGPSKKDQERPATNASILAAVFAGVIAFFPSQNDPRGNAAKIYPAAALNYLQEHPAPQPMLNEYGWADIYETAGVLKDYMDMTLLAPNAVELLQEVQHSIVPDPERAAAGNAASGGARVVACLRG